MLLIFSYSVRTLSLVDAEVSRLILWSCSAATSETSARADDHEMEDAATSNPGTVFLIPFLVD